MFKRLKAAFWSALVRRLAPHLFDADACQRNARNAIRTAVLDALRSEPRRGGPLQ